MLLNVYCLTCLSPKEIENTTSNHYQCQFICNEIIEIISLNVSQTKCKKLEKNKNVKETFFLHSCHRLQLSLSCLHTNM